MAPIVPRDDRALERAALALRAGEAVVVPTDTVYGVAVDPTIAGATQRLFAAKGRSRDVPIAVLVADQEQAWSIAAQPIVPLAVQLAHEHWPGALTIVVERAPGWNADIGDQDQTVGIRCPNDDWIRALCRRQGPLATTSANLHGQPTAIDAASAAVLFGDAVALVIDGGERHGAASTVILCAQDGSARVVREGAVRLPGLR
jgi:tRNA threonylcarbamoyl adenosine modification protein (Sua5/YciO/YrdC/YwlC family)